MEPEKNNNKKLTEEKKDSLLIDIVGAQDQLNIAPEEIAEEPLESLEEKVQTEEQESGKLDEERVKDEKQTEVLHGEQLSPWIISKLVSNGYLILNKEGDISQKSKDKLEKLLDSNHFILHRKEYLAQQAGITESNLSAKIYSYRLIDDFLTNLSEIGVGLYTYKKEDEEKIIELLKKRPRGRPKREGPLPKRREEIDIGPNLIKISDAAQECSITPSLLEEVLERVNITQRKMTVENFDITALDRDDYQKLRKYIWNIRQIENVPDIGNIHDYKIPEIETIQKIPKISIDLSSYDNLALFLKSLSKREARLEEIHCDKRAYNEKAVDLWKKAYKEGEFVLQPIVDELNNVIGFHDSYFAAQELKLQTITVLVYHSDPFDRAINLLENADRKQVNLEEIICDKNKYDIRMIGIWKKAYAEGKFVPSPVINEENVVIGFHDSYFVAKELGLKNLTVSVIPRKVG